MDRTADLCYNWDMKNTSKQPKIEKFPDFFRPLFWSYDFSSLDPIRDEKTAIVNAINYGDLKHWKWLKDFYGEKEVQKSLANISAREFRERALKLAGLIFSVKKFNYVSRGVK